MNIHRLLAEAGSRLAAFPDPRLEAEVLLCHALGVSRAWIYANSDHDIERQPRERFLQWLDRRAAGEPVAYITGNREFWSLRLKVTPDVLVPRPETEVLVQSVLDIIPPDGVWRVADLGTGSGAIALAIASERPLCDVHATDISDAALALAEENARSLGLSRVRFHQGSWLSPLQGRFKAIVSNPPYIAESDPHLEQGDCRFEPGIALTPGKDGMTSITLIAKDALASLEPGGFLAFEHGYDQGPASRKVLTEFGYRGVSTVRDLAGLERITRGYAHTK